MEDPPQLDDAALVDLVDPELEREDHEVPGGLGVRDEDVELGALARLAAEHADAAFEELSAVSAR
jgi:hypothetical protein